jgi:dTDP-glucose pyrophosphorylase
MRELDIYTVLTKDSIRSAIKKMDENGTGIVVCMNEDNIIVGILTDGDFRRAILKGVSLEENILKILNRNFYYLQKDYTEEDVIATFKLTKGKPIPILDKGKLIKVITEQEFFNIRPQEEVRDELKDLSAVIMAGGKGTRLDPLTKIIPKALIPIGDKPIIELIIEKYRKYGVKNFYISVNHKSRMIKIYFEDSDQRNNINYVDEEKPLGTAGSLKFLEKIIKTPLFVSNCDVLILADYYEIYKFHLSGNYSMTIVGSMQHHKIPYGVCEIEKGGDLKEFKEKPEFDFLVNTGMYVLNPEVLKVIPHSQYFDFNELINQLMLSNKRIGVFPVSEKSWIDVGQWDEYKKSLGFLGE